MNRSQKKHGLAPWATCFAVLTLLATGFLGESPCHAGPTTPLGRMSSGVRNFFVRTGDAINPWKTPPAPVKTTGSRRIVRADPQPEPSRRPFFANWFGPTEEPKKVESVGDFLDLPRVPY